MTPEEAAWFAGLYEGEGSVSCRITRRSDSGRSGNRDAVSLRIEVNMTDRDVIDTVARVAAAGRVYGPYASGTRNRPIYCWICTSPVDVRALCAVLRPLVFQRRREQIDAALAQYDARYRRCAGCSERRFQCRPCYDRWALLQAPRQG